MAVFWFGLGKKIKNIFTKKEADKLYGTITDVTTNKTEIAALKEVDSRIWDTINNVNAKIDDSIQTINNTPLSAATEWDFISGRNIQFSRDRVERIANNKVSTSQLTSNALYIMRIELANYSYRYGHHELIICMSEEPEGTCYSFSTPGPTYTFSIRKYNSNTVEIMLDKDLQINYFKLKRLYIK